MWRHNVILLSISSCESVIGVNSRRGYFVCSFDFHESSWSGAFMGHGLIGEAPAYISGTCTCSCIRSLEAE
ncbi:hypothetical protein GQ44DRAFT_713350 [Phaeosphaeriaceae sp. PMI808]|nr:hypothetical protein GQ44DRAFT_713350 [Phaeosphaeriaceae sp. PMI808]